MTTYRFQEIKVWGEKNLPCPVCGKKVRRRLTFMQTLNPWNVNKETGQPKTSAEIYKELHAERAEWATLPSAHGNCVEVAV